MGVPFPIRYASAFLREWRDAGTGDTCSGTVVEPTEHAEVGSGSSCWPVVVIRGLAFNLSPNSVE